MMSCIPNIGPFDSPDLLANTLHLITIISTPVHIFGLYCVLFKTPNHMKSVKLYLVNLHVWIVLFDYYLGCLGVPLLLFPALAGIPMGVMRYLGVPALFQAMGIVLIMAYVVCSITAVFENRFHVVCHFSGKSYWNLLRRPWLASHYIGVFIATISFAYLVPDQKSAKERVFQKLPCLPDYIYRDEVFIVTETGVYHLFMFVFYVVLTILEVSIFAYFLIWYSTQQLRTKSVSRRTFTIQKKFFIALVIQMSVPMVFILLPVFYAWISLFWYYYNQSLTNFCVVLASLHGISSTLVMIFVHHPYRKVLLGGV
ncbi:unnamed protein product [Caenorhabditis nigoni]